MEDTNDWQYEVLNGDTLLGFEEWKARRREESSKQGENNVPERVE